MIESIRILVMGSSVKFVDVQSIMKEGCEDINMVMAMSDKDLPGIPR